MPSRSQATDLKPRRSPRQARSRANVDALLDATAHLLRKDGYAALTTNHIAERAGVSIGTLYQFFPGKEAIVAALAEQLARDARDTVLRDLPAALDLRDRAAAVDLLVRRIAGMLAADRRLYGVLLRDAPFLQHVKSVRETVDALIAATEAQLAPRRDGARVETWLLGRMAYEALVAIAVFREGPEDTERSLDAFIRLLLRLLGGA